MSRYYAFLDNMTKYCKLFYVFRSYCRQAFIYEIDISAPSKSCSPCPAKKIHSSIFHSKGLNFSPSLLLNRFFCKCLSPSKLPCHSNSVTDTTQTFKHTYALARLIQISSSSSSSSSSSPYHHHSSSCEYSDVRE